MARLNGLDQSEGLNMLRIVSGLFLCVCAAASTGCDILIDKAINEGLGGQGESQPANALPAGTPLAKYAGVKVLSPIEVSAEAIKVPSTLPGQLETELKRRLVESELFPAGAQGPIFEIKIRIKTYWQATGAMQAVSAYSEVIGLVEFAETRSDGSRAVLGMYEVKGYSEALSRRDAKHLLDGFTREVTDLVKKHRKAD